MNKRFLVNWSILIGVVSGIYCAIYSLLPLPTQSLMWMTFVALPIYFNGGAKIEEYPHYVVSMLAGVGWGVIYLYFLGAFGAIGVSTQVNLLVIVTIITAICCAFHFCVTGNTWLNKLPIMFGAIASTFSQNGKNLTTIIITLFGGLTVAMIVQQGTKLLDEQGRWSFGGNKNNLQGKEEI